MRIKEKIVLFEQLHTAENLDIEFVYEVLEKCDALKKNYQDYMISEPVDCDQELERLNDADYDLCCALLTMLLREDHFCNGMFQRRQRSGQVKMIVERILIILKESKVNKQSFSEKALIALNGYYVYALIDPRDNKVFYIGKGIGNRVFMHEIESGKSLESEKLKLKKIRDIENAGFSVKKLIVNWGLTESEAFASEATLINMLNYIPDIKLSNIVSGHHVHECFTTEQFEQTYGAVPLEKKDIKHSILVIKINKLYRRDMSEYELYDAVRGFWAASLKSIQR